MFFSKEAARRITEGFQHQSERIRALEQWRASFKEAVPEFLTGVLLDKSMADKVELVHPNAVASTNKVLVQAPRRAGMQGFINDVKKFAELYFGSGGPGDMKQYAYFRRGTAPKCDYIMCDGEKITYWKRGKTPKDSQVKKV